VKLAAAALAGLLCAAGLAAGDAHAGRAVFEKQGCFACHVAGNQGGGALGPDLTDIAVLRSPESLRRALTDPDAEVPAAYVTITVVTRKGDEIRGIRLNILYPRLVPVRTLRRIGILRHMPETLPLPPETLQALGRMAMDFGGFEYWVNIGIFEAEDLRDVNDQQRIALRGLGSHRLERLKGDLEDAERKHWVSLDRYFHAAFWEECYRVIKDRNNLLHGAVMTYLDMRTNPCGVIYVSHNFGSGQGTHLTVEAVKGLSQRILDLKERLHFCVLDFCSAKHSHGVQPIFWGPAGPVGE
jgi:hypothetical protein